MGYIHICLISQLNYSINNYCILESSCLAAVMTHRCRSSSKCYSDVDLCDGFDDCGGTNSTDEATCGKSVPQDLHVNFNLRIFLTVE